MYSEENKMRCIFKNTFKYLNHYKNRLVILHRESEHKSISHELSIIGSYGERSFNTCNIQPQLLIDAELHNDKLTLKHLCVDQVKLNQYKFMSSIKGVDTSSSGKDKDNENSKCMPNEYGMLVQDGVGGKQFRLVSSDFNN